MGATIDMMKLLYVTTPSLADAETLARRLVDSNLAACVNILPQMRSVYRWDGDVETAEESVLIVKTSSNIASTARDFIVTHHPYETPCVIALDVSDRASNPDFLEWVAEETKAAKKI